MPVEVKVKMAVSLNAKALNHSFRVRLRVPLSVLVRIPPFQSETLSTNQTWGWIVVLVMVRLQDYDPIRSLSGLRRTPGSAVFSAVGQSRGSGA